MQLYDIKNTTGQRRVIYDGNQDSKQRPIEIPPGAEVCGVRLTPEIAKELQARHDQTPDLLVTNATPRHAPAQALGAATSGHPVEEPKAAEGQSGKRK